MSTTTTYTPTAQRTAFIEKMREAAKIAQEAAALWNELTDSDSDAANSVKHPFPFSCSLDDVETEMRYWLEDLAEEFAQVDGGQADATHVIAADALAIQFAECLKECMSGEDMKEVNRRNKERSSVEMCATNDFCDPAACMLDAISRLGIPSWETFAWRQNNAALIDDAWEIARNAGFFMEAKPFDVCISSAGGKRDKWYQNRAGEVFTVIPAKMDEGEVYQVLSNPTDQMLQSATLYIEPCDCIAVK